ncbi:four-carbon acid sugar kinase family protein [Shinella sp. NM-101]|uniref:four-carbon acid sugar kinase family protein n=1 Tax=Shinella sp. NM-101 TaxID=2744455 RepID=UPI001F43FD5A
MSRLRLIADDLTGALDSGCAFADADAPVRIAVPGQPLPAGERVAVSTESRDMEEAQAVAAVAAAVHAFGAESPDTLWFKKIDSVMRGHPFAETLAALEAGGFSACVFAPAYPEMGRITRDGRQYRVDGAGAPVSVGPDFRQALGPLGPVLTIIDAERQETLRAHVARLRLAPAAERTLWVGTGGLAAALAGARVPAPFPPLRCVIVGTRHPVTRTQVERAIADSTVAEGPGGEGLARLLAPAFTAASAAETHALVRRHLPDVDLGAADAASLLVTGGDTLSVVLEATGAEVLDCIGEAATGVPVSRIRGGRWDGVTILSKSGGFGDTDLLSRLASRHGEP